MPCRPRIPCLYDSRKYLKTLTCQPGIAVACCGRQPHLKLSEASGALMSMRRFARTVAPILVFSTLVFGVLEGLARSSRQGITSERQSVRITELILNPTSVTSGQSVTARVSVSSTDKPRGASVSLTFWMAPARSQTAATLLLRKSLGKPRPDTSLTVLTSLPIPSSTPAGHYSIIASIDVTITPDSPSAALLVSQPLDSQLASPPPGSSEPQTLEEPVSASPTTETDDTASTSPDSSTSAPTSSASSSTAAAPSPTTSTSPTTSASSSTLTTASAPCDYYASPNGSGNGLMTSTPFRIQDFWSLATPGTTLCLLDGLYQGTSNMIDPPDGLSGTGGVTNWPPPDKGIVSGSRPITVRALNDGKVLIDGQFQRTPVSLNGNSWFVLEGFNAKSSSGSVIAMQANSNNNILRRVVAWDANIRTNVMTITLNGSSRALFEDVAAFGTGRKVINNSQGGNDLTCRRCWARWEGSIRHDAKMAFALMYNSFRALCENCLATASAESMPEEFNERDDPAAPRWTNFTVLSPRGLLSVDRNDSVWNVLSGVNTLPMGTRVLGSIAYQKSTDRFINWIGLVRTFGAETDVHHRHILTFSPYNHRGLYYPDRTGDSYGSVTGTNRSVHNVARIGRGSPNDVLGLTWEQQNILRLTSQGTYSPWTNPLGATGANLCHKYVNGVRTTEPLWPWPMNERIKQATATAGAYRGPCATCTGGRLVRTATDVTADIEALFGQIPSQCRN